MSIHPDPPETVAVPITTIEMVMAHAKALSVASPPNSRMGEAQRCSHAASILRQLAPYHRRDPQRLLTQALNDVARLRLSHDPPAIGPNWEGPLRRLQEAAEAALQELQLPHEVS